MSVTATQKNMRQTVGDRCDEKYIITVDVGCRGTGVAFWWLHGWRRLTHPFFIADIVPPKHLQWEEALYEVIAELNRLTHPFSYSTCNRIYYEMPEFRDTASGHGVARSGDFAKLCAAAGAIIGFAWYKTAAVIPVPVHQWKGQLPKEIVRERIRAKLPDYDFQHITTTAHAWDAIGLGLYCKGHF